VSEDREHLILRLSRKWESEILIVRAGYQRHPVVLPLGVEFAWVVQHDLSVDHRAGVRRCIHHRFEVESEDHLVRRQRTQTGQRGRVVADDANAFRKRSPELLTGCACALARVAQIAPDRDVGVTPPDSTIAFWNSPVARGDVRSACTEYPPADSPNSVTLRGSPPNAAIFRCTHCNAAI
jgi:hypothetical protein